MFITRLHQHQFSEVFPYGWLKEELSCGRNTSHNFRTTKRQLLKHPFEVCFIIARYRRSNMYAYIHITCTHTYMGIQRGHFPGMWT